MKVKGLTSFQRNVVTAFQFHGAGTEPGIKQDSGGFTSLLITLRQILNALTVSAGK
ncbi:hypothetical protein ACNKHU_10090 [Shigella flexneri]